MCIRDRVKGAEALVRWIDPVRGLVPPNDFIPLFERNGFVVDLDPVSYTHLDVYKRQRQDHHGNADRRARDDAQHHPASARLGGGAIAAQPSDFRRRVRGLSLIHI